METDKRLSIYLNDHLAGASAGAELARRLAAAGHAPRELAAEIEEDRATLLELMAALAVPVRRYKTWLGWLGEKATRLKQGGAVLELEAMRLGVEGKAAGWRTLRTRADHDTRLDKDRIDALLTRANRQIDQLEKLRLAAAEKTLV